MDKYSMQKDNFSKLHWLLANQIGFAPRLFFNSIRRLPRFIRDLREFRNTYKGIVKLKPCLHDRYEEGGTTKSEYFWQDLLVARWIYAAKPDRHVDIGSRVDGFVAHIASFRDIEVFDVRPISTQIPGVVFKQANFMQGYAGPAIESGYCDSLSCLHALEHFGLGRYGDPIAPMGHELGLANMAALLKPGGTLYLSIPIGEERVEFNANWVFNPIRIVNLAEGQGLLVQKLTIVGAGGVVEDVTAIRERLQILAKANYNLGIFVFIKPSAVTTR